jgi:hypothetical protein
MRASEYDGYDIRRMEVISKSIEQVEEAVKIRTGTDAGNTKEDILTPTLDMYEEKSEEYKVTEHVKFNLNGFTSILLGRVLANTELIVRLHPIKKQESDSSLAGGVKVKLYTNPEDTK